MPLYFSVRRDTRWLGGKVRFELRLFAARIAMTPQPPEDLPMMSSSMDEVHPDPPKPRGFTAEDRRK